VRRNPPEGTCASRHRRSRSQMAGMAARTGHLRPDPDAMSCRLCGSETITFVDLGRQPLANSYLNHPDDDDPRYPLHAKVCTACQFVQLDPAVTPDEIFTDYSFISGASTPWKTHCETYVDTVTRELRLDDRSHVLEIASNDGTLLSCFDGPK